MQYDCHDNDDNLRDMHMYCQEPYIQLLLLIMYNNLAICFDILGHHQDTINSLTVHMYVLTEENTT
jgi:hypothetical protein